MAEVETTQKSDQDTSKVDEYQRGISDGFNESAALSTTKSKRLYCFACHRMEYHYNALKGAYYHHLLIGITFGLALIFGPYRCRCCGYRRMVRYNFLNPRFHYHRWKYSKTSSNSSTKSKSSKKSRASSSRSSSGQSSRREKDRLVELSTEARIRADEPEPLEPASHNGSRRRRRKQKSKKLKSVPIVDNIGKDRRKQKEQEIVEQLSTGQVDFSIDGLVGSFETEESRKQRLAEIEDERAQRDPFVAKKAKPRKKIKGKPKRRFAKKERLTGPKLYCFTCKQTNEHFHFLKGNSLFFFFFGITFGLISIVGPMRCSICSKRRLFCADFLNPKYYIRHILSNSKNGYW